MKALIYFFWVMGFFVNAVVPYVIINSTVKNKRKPIVTIMLIGLINFMMQVLRDYVFVDQPVGVMVVSFGTNIACIFLLFKGKISRKIQAFIEFFISVLIAELISATILVTMLNSDQRFMYEMCWERVFVNYFSSVVHGAVVAIFILIKRRNKYAYILKENTIIIVSLAIQLAGMEVWLQLLYRYPVDVGILFWGYVLISILANIIVIQAMAMLGQKQNTEEELEKISFIDNSVSEYYQAVTANLYNLDEIKESYNEKLKAIYNEYNIPYEINQNDSMTVESSIVLGEGKKQSDTDIDHTVENLQVINEQEEADVATHNRIIIENIINSKKSVLDLLECDYEISLSEIIETKMELIDISSLINNMFDNAIEGIRIYKENEKQGEKTSRFNEKHLVAKMYKEKDNYVIEIENVKSDRQQTIESDGRFITSKKDKVGHGYGMSIIEKIAKKYGGDMEVTYTKKRFKNRVEIKA